MKGATVKAYAQPNGGPVLLEIFVGDKRHGTISLRPSGDDGFDFAYDNIAGEQFLRVLRDAALEARKEA